MKVLVVIDMQNDFIDGSLGSKEALNILPAALKKIEKADREGSLIFFTQDMHDEDYKNTLEGKYLPIKHCIKDTEGVQIIPEFETFVTEDNTFIKHTFGSLVLTNYIKVLSWKYEEIEIELIGVCTDICVISNALLLKASLPEVEITVDASCCAGVTPESHKSALQVMKSCQIKIINE